MISILISSDLENLKKEIRYALGFVFQSLGYSYNFITDTDQLRPQDILVIYAYSEPTIDDLRALAKRYVTLYIPADIELYDHKAYTPDKLRKNIKEVKLLSPTPVISARVFTYPASNYADQEINAGKFSFDLIGNVFFHLSGMEEKIDSARNEAGFYPESSSAFYKYREIPYVDNLLWLMDSMLREHGKARKQYSIQKMAWPLGQESAVVLTHSVDDLQKWDLGSMVLSIADDIMMILSFSFKQFWHQLTGKIKYVFTNYELNWNFDEFRKLERDAGMRSNFFIAAHNSKEIDYSLDDPDLAEEIKDLVKEGNEIGLLITEDKLNRDEQMTRKQILLHQTKCPDAGCRQLDYLMDHRLMDLHNAINPQYSMSSSLQNNPGYKCGTGMPYNPWISSGKAVYTEIPTVYRDKFLKLNRFKTMGLEDAKHQVRRFLQNASRTHGVFALDFRIASYTDIYYCEKLYAYILALIKSHKSWVCKAGELANWWRKRGRVVVDESEYEFSVFFPDDLDNLSLQVNGDVKIVEIDGVAAKIDGNQIRFSSVKAESVAVIRLDHNR